MSRKTILVVSDIHYACEAEQAREGHETRSVKNPLARAVLRLYRDHFWLKNPTQQNHLLDQFILHAPEADFVVANGDFTCDTAFIGLADDAACQSARECLGKLRKRFSPDFAAVYGDHEVGKMSMLGNQGGMRLASWRRAQQEIGLPFWTKEIGRYVLIGVVSSLLAYPVFEPETIAAERDEWQKARTEHWQQIRSTFRALRPEQKVLLFCHNPSALPFLWREEDVRAKTSQIENTIIGHLHSPIFLWKSRLLAGMPIIRFFGNTVRRYSTALHEARHWREFKVKLCPSLGGIELLKDGGFLKLTIDPDGNTAAQFERIKILR